MTNFHADPRKEQILTMVQAVIEQLHIIEDSVVTLSLSNLDCKLLVFAIETEIVTGEQLHSWLHARLLEVGREAYVEHTENGEHLNHTVSPQCLAYAIAHSRILPAEAATIRFDHGETVRTFFKDIEQDLVARIWRSVLDKVVRTGAGPMLHIDLFECVIKHKTIAAA